MKRSYAIALTRKLLEILAVQVTFVPHKRAKVALRALKELPYCSPSGRLAIRVLEDAAAGKDTPQHRLLALLAKAHRESDASCKQVWMNVYELVARDALGRHYNEPELKKWLKRTLKLKRKENPLED